MRRRQGEVARSKRSLHRLLIQVHLVVLRHIVRQGPLVDIQLPLEALLQLGQVLAVWPDGASRHGPGHTLAVAVLVPVTNGNTCVMCVFPHWSHP